MEKEARAQGYVPAPAEMIGALTARLVMYQAQSYAGQTEWTVGSLVDSQEAPEAFHFDESDLTKPANYNKYNPNVLVLPEFETGTDFQSIFNQINRGMEKTPYLIIPKSKIFDKIIPETPTDQQFTIEDVWQMNRRTVRGGAWDLYDNKVMPGLEEIARDLANLELSEAFTALFDPNHPADQDQEVDALGYSVRLKRDANHENDPDFYEGNQIQWDISLSLPYLDDPDKATRYQMERADGQWMYRTYDVVKFEGAETLTKPPQVETITSFDSEVLQRLKQAGFRHASSLMITTVATALQEKKRRAGNPDSNFIPYNDPPLYHDSFLQSYVGLYKGVGSPLIRRRPNNENPFSKPADDEIADILGEMIEQPFKATGTNLTEDSTPPSDVSSPGEPADSSDADSSVEPPQPQE